MFLLICKKSIGAILLCLINSRLISTMLLLIPFICASQNSSEIAYNVSFDTDELITMNELNGEHSTYNIWTLHDAVRTIDRFNDDDQRKSLMNSDLADVISNSLYLTAPVAVCQDITIQVDASGNASIVGTDIDGGSTDDGTIVSYIASQTNFDCSHLGPNSVTLTVTDNLGNMSSCLSTVTVEDVILPISKCKSATLQLDATGNVTLTPTDINNASFDNCTLSQTVSRTSFNCSDIGSHSVNLLSEDQSGNTSLCPAPVTIVDISPPAISGCPTDDTISGDSNCEVTVPDYTGIITYTDNCSAVSNITISQNIASGTTVSSDQNIVLTVTDEYGNSSTCNFTLIIGDSSPPQFNCLSLTSSLPANGTCSAIVPNYQPEVLATLSDNCSSNGNISFSQTPLAGTVITVNTPISVLVIDESGNSYSCNKTLKVIDITPPSISGCPSDLNVNADINCEAILQGYTSVPLISDNCAATISQFPLPGSVTTGTITITLTASDVAGNTSDCSFDITVVDITDPDIPILSDITDECSVSVLPPSTTDNCAGVIIATTLDALTYTSQGTYIITWTFDDGSGNSIDVNQNVIIDDVTSPNLTPQDITVQLNGSGSITVTGTDVSTSSDNCSGLIISLDNDTFGCVDIGPNVVTITATDGGGNQVIETATVTVEDNENPVAVCLDITVGLDVLGNAVISASDVDGGSSDNCSIVSYIIDRNSFTGADLGPNNVVLTVTDQSGNTDNCIAVVTVSDNDPPIAICQDISIFLDSFGNASITASDIDGGSTDNDIIVSLLASQTNFDCSHLGTNVVTLTVTDNSGNVDNCISNVMVIDLENPTITSCAVSRTESTDGNCEFTLPDYTSEVLYTDNCGAGGIIITQNPPVGTVFSGEQIINVEITIEDSSGNSDLCLFTITTTDTTPPQVICQNITIELQSDGTVSIMASDIDGGTTDNCLLLSLNASPLNFTNANMGANTVTLIAEDAAGNISSCDAIVTLVDTISPTAICQDITVELDFLGEVSIVPADVDGGSFDNGSIASLQISQSDFSCVHIGANNVTLMVIDDSGNSGTCNATVTVVDNGAPIITECPTDIYQYLGDDCQYIIEDFISELEYYDNCTGLNDIAVVQTPVPGTIISSSSMINCTLTLTDLAGNSDQCDFVLNVQDITDPFIDCVDTVVVDTNADCNYEVMAFDQLITFYDNCSTSLNVIQNPPVGTMINENTLSILEVTDESGNTTICEFELVLRNDSPPSIDCLSNQVIPISQSCVGIVPDYISQVSIQPNCGSTLSSVIQTPAPNTQIVTSQMVTITAIDDAGNVASCSFMVELSNPNSPIVECINDQQLEVLQNCEVTLPDYSGDISIALQCDATIVSIEQNPISGTLINTTQLVTLTVTDSAGNVSMCEFEVTLIDLTTPIIECTDDIEQTDSTVVYNVPEFSDNCEVELNLIEGGASGSVFAHGYTAVTYQALDLSGNADTCSFSVLINTPPIAINDTIQFEIGDLFGEDSIMMNDYDLDGDTIQVVDFYSENDSLNVSISAGGNIQIEILHNWCGMDSIQYTICDEYGYCDEASVIIQVGCFNQLIIPKGFSPNNDGVNDMYEIIGIEYFPKNSIQVFNRWGRLIFSEENYRNNWDGRASKKSFKQDGLVPMGTYYSLIDLGDGSKIIKSYIHIKY